MLSVECGVSFKFEGLPALTTECLNHSFYNCERKIEFQFFYVLCNIFFFFTSQCYWCSLMFFCLIGFKVSSSCIGVYLVCSTCLGKTFLSLSC
jgi:hypothetical protein